MTDTPWTPGPWKVGPYDPESGAYHLHPYLVQSRLEMTEAYVPDSGNARLIAAAPEMAELLSSFADTPASEGPAAYGMGSRAEALLSRIRGEA